MSLLPGPGLRDFLSNVYVIIGVVDWLMALVVIYMILYHSPKHFRSYKWVQLTLALSILYSDTWGVLASAVFIPHTFGFIVLAKIDYGPIISNLLGCLLLDGIYLQFAAVSLAFYRRVYYIIPTNLQRFWKKGEMTIIPTIFTTIHIVPVAVFLSVPSDPVQHLNNTINKFPELSLLRDMHERLVLYDTNSSAFGVVKWYLLTIFLLFIPFCLYAFYCIRVYLVNATAISSKTRRLQMSLLYSLLLQCSIPLSICAIPYWSLGYSFYDDKFYIPYVTQYADLVCCTHSTINSLLLILLTKPYKERIFEFFGGPPKRESNTASMAGKRISGSVSPKTIHNAPSILIY